MGIFDVDLTKSPHDLANVGSAFLNQSNKIALETDIPVNVLNQMWKEYKQRVKNENPSAVIEDIARKTNYSTEKVQDVIKKMFDYEY